jgi:hypothetical protein
MEDTPTGGTSVFVQNLVEMEPNIAQGIAPIPGLHMAGEIARDWATLSTLIVVILTSAQSTGTTRPGLNLRHVPPRVIMALKLGREIAATQRQCTRERIAAI